MSSKTQKQYEYMWTMLNNCGVHLCGSISEFYGQESANQVIGIWIAADHTPELFDYYSMEWQDTLGVHPLVNQVVEKEGWYFEWYDGATIMCIFDNCD